MNCDELQIGNWVAVKPSLMPVCIAAVHKRKIGYHVHQYNLKWVRHGLLEPISLTDEILEKNFDRVGDAFRITGFWKILSNPNYGYIAATLAVDDFGAGFYEPCIPCRYVHELQNLLRILKIKKGIIL